MASVVERAWAGEALTVLTDVQGGQLGHPCNYGRREEKNPIVYVTVEKYPAVPWGNELRVQRGQWWSQGSCWGRGAGTGERLSYDFCPHCQSHEVWQVWFLGSDRAA